MSATGTAIALSKFAPRIGEYLGLIEGVSSNVKKLLHDDFLSAKSNLNYALNSLKINDEDTARSYLLDARKEFNRATHLEENENLVSSYAGLALCQYLLGENLNAYTTIQEINKVKISTAARSLAMGKDLIGLPKDILDEGEQPVPNLPYNVVRRIFGRKGYYESCRLGSLESYKNNAYQLINSIIN